MANSPCYYQWYQPQITALPTQVSPSTQTDKHDTGSPDALALLPAVSCHQKMSVILD